MPARLVCFPNLQDWVEDVRAHRHRLFWESLSKTSSQLHLVGKSKRFRWKQCFRGWISRPGQHRSFQPLGTLPSINGEDHAESADKSVDADGEERKREKTEANQHVANHVTTQLDLIRSNDSSATYEDEFEAQLDAKWWRHVSNLRYSSNYMWIFPFN